MRRIRVCLLSILVFTLIAASGAMGAIVPSAAPRNARCLITGNGFIATDIIHFTGPNGPVAASILARSDKTLDVVVPATAISGSVEVVRNGAVVDSSAFTVAPEPELTSVTTIATGGALHAPAGVAMNAAGDFLIADTKQNQIRALRPDGTMVVLVADGLKEPRGIAVDFTGEVFYVADSGNHAIRRVTFNGVMSTLAGTGSPGDADGTAERAEFKDPAAVAVDTIGNVYVADAGNHKIRRISPDGMVTTVAGTGQPGFADGAAAQARFHQVEGIAVASDGTIYVADTVNHAIRRIANGVVTTLAGSGKPGRTDGSGMFAQFALPAAVALDEYGALLVADTGNHLIRRVDLFRDPAQVITIAGSGSPALTDGAPAQSQFKQPAAIAALGIIAIADTGNDAIRIIARGLRVTAVYPRVGPVAGGNEVRIFGVGFIPGRTTVTIGGRDAVVTFASATEIRVVAPAGSAGAADVAVTALARTATLGGAYTYLPAPTVTSVLPRKGASTGGETVTLRGTGFMQGETRVVFGSADATDVVVSDATTLTARTPAGIHGPVAVTVITPGGSGALADAFFYFAPPVIAGFAPASGGAGTTVTISGNYFDPDANGNVVRFGTIPSPVLAATSTSLVTTVPANAETAPIAVSTAGGTARSNSDFVTRVLSTITITPPSATLAVGGTLQLAAKGTYSDGSVRDITSEVSWSSGQPAVASVDANGLVTAAAQGSATISAALSSLTGNANISVGAAGLPPDPAAVAPAVSSSVTTQMFDSVAFLFQGPNPVQFDVAPGTINAVRVAVLRGRILDGQRRPLPGVRVEMHRDGSYGWTRSREDGQYDFAVNGGGRVTLTFRKDGFLESHRSFPVPQGDYTTVDDVVLIEQDPAVTPIDLGSTSLQIARGSSITDADGTRQAAMFFRPGTAATMRMPDGTTRALTTMHVRATEYTAGESGPLAMPAELPAQSGYTYCVELSVDEAIDAGATSVEFGRPVIVYVDNFLGFKVGGIVPVGSYDRQRAEWVAAPNGSVIKILSVSGGVAMIDLNGDGSADPDSALTTFGIDLEERQTLATNYTAGQSLWRVPVTHFTPWDCNWPYGPPPGALPPGMPPPGSISGPETSGPDCAIGSIIDCQNQGLGEQVTLTGTSYALHYDSRRMAGHRPKSVIKFELTGATLPPQLKRIDLTFTIAGKETSLSFAPSQNLTYTYEWDGLDAYGRRVQGMQTIHGKTDFVYPAVYQEPAQFAQAFALLSGVPITGNRARFEVALSQEWKAQIGSFMHWDPQSQGLGGWTITPHHVYDLNTATVHFGYGGSRNVGYVIETVGGTGALGHTGNGGPIRTAQIGPIVDIAFAPDGTYYIADAVAYTIRKVTPDGKINAFAGTQGSYQARGDGGPASAASFYPANIALMKDGSMLIADSPSRRIRKIDPSGIITTIAGTGTSGSTGDGGPATSATFISPEYVAAGPDGSVYVGDRGFPAWNVRRITPDGRISTIAGNGSQSAVENIPATDFARFASIGGLHVDQQGNVYVGENWYAGTQRVWKIGTDGIITRFAGAGPNTFTGDGGSARNATLYGPVEIDSDANGNIYILEIHNEVVRVVASNGVIRTIAGSGYHRSYAGDGGPAANAQFMQPEGFAVAPDGSIYVADTHNYRVRRIASPMPTVGHQQPVLASEDGSEAYVFDAKGRHLRTVDSLTGFNLFTFAYGGDQLTSITDHNGNITRIGRSAESILITAPGGQQTTVALNADDFMASIANPQSETTRFEYTSKGLMTKLITPRDGTHEFEYDDFGLLTRDKDPVGGYKELSATNTRTSRSIMLRTAGGRTSTYSSSISPVGTKTAVGVAASGVAWNRTTDSSEKSTFTDSLGGVLTVERDADPRFGMQAPLVKSSSLRLSSGLTSQMSESRTSELANSNDVLSLRKSSRTLMINGNPWKAEYDATTRKETFRTPLGQVIGRTLDTAGRVTREEVTGLAPFELSYDGQGRLTSMSQGRSAFTLTYHGSTEQLQRLSDNSGNFTEFSYDDAGRVTRQTFSDGRSVAFGYDADGNTTSVQPPGRPEHRFEFTKTGELERYTAPDGATTEYQYNLDGQFSQILRADGRKLDYGYDGNGRITSTTSPSGSLGFTWAGVQLTGITAPDVNVALSYEGRFVKGMSWSGTVSGSVARSFNNNFFTASESVNGTPVSFAYDNDLLLSAAGGLTLQRNRQTSRITGSTLGGVTDSYTYDESGNVVGYTASYNGAPLVTFTYQRDAMSRVSSVTETIGTGSATTGYVYDAASRLKAVTSGGSNIAEYEYDANGNRTSLKTPLSTRAATYDDLDRLLTYDGLTFTYSAEGELSTRTAGGVASSFTYDTFGNLRNVSTTGMSIDYVVDGQHRRIGKKVNGTLVRGWLYAGNRIVAELDGSGAVLSRFVYGSRAHVPDYIVAGGATYRVITDHLGSPRLFVNTQTGSIAQRLDYNEYGVVITDTNPGFQPFGFAGGLYDRDTRLVHFGARDYDPHVGRWTTRDPLGFSGGDTNLYVYTMNDPVNLIDPSGLLFGGTVNAGEAYGEAALETYADILTDPDAAWYEKAGAAAGGFFSALWTPCTSDSTFTVLSTAAGGAGGLRAAGSKAAGKEFSHWIPNRLLKNTPDFVRNGFGLSRANGNYVTAAEHALNDPFRYRFMPAAWKTANPINSPLVRQFNRLPKALVGTGAGAAVGGAASAGGGGCGCP